MKSHNLRTPLSASIVQDHQKNKRQRREDIRLTKMMLTIFILFLICFLPLMLVNVLDDDMTQPSVHIIASVLAWMSATINPIIYSFLNKHYQKAFRTLLCLNNIREKRSSGLSLSQGLRTPESSSFIVSSTTLAEELKYF